MSTLVASMWVLKTIQTLKPNALYVLGERERLLLISFCRNDKLKKNQNNLNAIVQFEVSRGA